MKRTHSASIINVQQTSPRTNRHRPTPAQNLSWNRGNTAGRIRRDIGKFTWRFLATGKFAIGYYRGDKSTLISQGIDEVSPFLLLLVAALSIGHYYGVIPAVDVFRAFGITALIGAADLALILDLSLFLDFLIGDIFGLAGLRNLLTGLAVFVLGGPVVNYFKAIRNQ